VTWKVLYLTTAPLEWDERTQRLIKSWEESCATGPPFAGAYPQMRIEDENFDLDERPWEIPIPGTALVATCFLAGYEKLIIVKELS